VTRTAGRGAETLFTPSDVSGPGFVRRIVVVGVRTIARNRSVGYASVSRIERSKRSVLAELLRHDRMA